MKTKLFLSNSEIADQEFLDFCSQHHFELHAKSLISFKPVDHDDNIDADVVFFSSPRSVDFFYKSLKDKNVSLAVLGSGTATRLKALGFSPDFVGSASGNPDVVAKEFVHWLGKRTVLFPLSSRSNRSISSNIPKDQLKEIIVYETLTVPQTIEVSQIYVFTSPSTVEAFLGLNTVPVDAVTIAWGKTTEKKMLEQGITPSFVLEISSLRELERVLLKYLRAIMVFPPQV